MDSTRRRHKYTIPRRIPSPIILPREISYRTSDKTTCTSCPCFPKEEPYLKYKILLSCLKSPLTLYELASKVVDLLPLPEVLSWSTTDVANWISDDVGFPHYKDCFLCNGIDGYRLIVFEDPSKLCMINIHYWDHMKIISARVRHLYHLDYIEFSRGINLPPRRLQVHFTWFKSRTAPPWSDRRNWTFTQFLRWMKILGPEPVHLDHWDRVWYAKPDFPVTKFGRIRRATIEKIPMYKAEIEKCPEYLVPRKFPIIPVDEPTLIWMEHPRPVRDVIEEDRKREIEKRRKKEKARVADLQRLLPKKIDLTQYKGKEFILARRLMPKKKF